MVVDAGGAIVCGDMAGVVVSRAQLMGWGQWVSIDGRAMCCNTGAWQVVVDAGRSYCVLRDGGEKGDAVRSSQSEFALTAVARCMQHRKQGAQA
jgi:hypothetical protein